MYRSHSPIARDTCHLEAGEARKLIIGKGLKLSMLLNSGLVLCVEPDRCISQYESFTDIYYQRFLLGFFDTKAFIFTE